MDFKKMSFEDIVNWCKENNQIEWLKAELDKKEQIKVYPRKKIVNSEGKKVSVADKTQEPVVKSVDLTFVTLKYDFCSKFMPEIMPEKKEKKPTMKKKLALLLGEQS